MTEQHPITPPPELVQQWLEDSPKDDELGIAGYIATQAARWGADQELEACCEYIGYPSPANIQRFMFEAGFDVPDSDLEPAFPRAEYMKLAARIVDWTLIKLETLDD